MENIFYSTDFKLTETPSELFQNAISYKRQKKISENHHFQAYIYRVKSRQSSTESKTVLSIAHSDPNRSKVLKILLFNVIFDLSFHRNFENIEIKYQSNIISFSNEEVFSVNFLNDANYH